MVGGGRYLCHILPGSWNYLRILMAVCSGSLSPFSIVVFFSTPISCLVSNGHYDQTSFLNRSRERVRKNAFVLENRWNLRCFSRIRWFHLIAPTYIYPNGVMNEWMSNSRQRAQKISNSIHIVFWAHSHTRTCSHIRRPNASSFQFHIFASFDVSVSRAVVASHCVTILPLFRLHCHSASGNTIYLVEYWIYIQLNGKKKQSYEKRREEESYFPALVTLSVLFVQFSLHFAIHFVFSFVRRTVIHTHREQWRP